MRPLMVEALPKGRYAPSVLSHEQEMEVRLLERAHVAAEKLKAVVDKFIPLAETPPLEVVQLQELVGKPVAEWTDMEQWGTLVYAHALDTKTRERMEHILSDLQAVLTARRTDILSGLKQLWRKCGTDPMHCKKVEAFANSGLSKSVFIVLSKEMTKLKSELLPHLTSAYASLETLWKQLNIPQHQREVYPDPATLPDLMENELELEQRVEKYNQEVGRLVYATTIVQNFKEQISEMQTARAAEQKSQIAEERVKSFHKGYSKGVHKLHVMVNAIFSVKSLKPSSGPGAEEVEEIEDAELDAEWLNRETAEVHRNVESLSRESSKRMIQVGQRFQEGRHLLAVLGWHEKQSEMEPFNITKVPPPPSSATLPSPLSSPPCTHSPSRTCILSSPHVLFIAHVGM
ncbi:hypothetical protein CYMTET_53472 [Cymbomonas tetramitiformis]|uniref:Uncharacterized protein n=1 Tax=Cymbomonas tetramitiformis TaxID=36881 RepID=A0AAE0BH56_9CHLO|nr:hypothetical protein CYMTET_53472 [Cymbomonas tetramitiformis]